MADPANLIVCGGRDYNDQAAVFSALDRAHSKRPINFIIHGAATGADRLAARWAQDRCVPHLAVPADWKAHGKAAGPMRNQHMIEMVVDGVIAFPGGAGTADMVARAKKAGVPVWEPYRG